MSSRQGPPIGATIWPLTFAVGVAVALVGLIVNPVVITPLGVAIALLAAVRWTRRSAPLARSSPRPAPQGAQASAERYSRSRFLGRATVAVGGLVGIAAAAPSIGLSVLGSFRRQPDKPVALGPLDAFPEGRFVISTFLADPAQGAVSRRTAYVRNNGLVRGLPSFTVLSSRCTHVGCPTQPEGLPLDAQRKAERTPTGPVSLVPTAAVAGFGCPCHGSQFDQEGNRTAGPAARALDRYGFSVVDGELWLGPRYSVSHVDGTGALAHIHAFPLLDPGEPVTGPERLFYALQPPR
jgi:Rieske Fe-S protein